MTLKSKTSILLGAGMSIDAGLPDTNRLTSAVYNRLNQSLDKVPATVFGYVVSKLAARHARMGGSPFDPVNIEQAYDLLLRLFRRDTDPLSEFVYSWDPILDITRRPFDTWRFANDLKGAFSVSNRRSLSGAPHIEVDNLKLRSAADQIASSFNPGSSDTDSHRSVVPDIIGALIAILSEPPQRTDYFNQLISFCQDNDIPVATLNYDTYLENAANSLGITADYGLDEWNTRRQVSWQKDSLRVLKLHGSTNWLNFNEDIHIDTSYNGYNERLIIFGGQSEKLNPHGPFLQLRNAFERNLMLSNRLLVVGYSFADLHLNSLIKSWVATRRSAKMVVLDPGNVSFNPDLVGLPYKKDNKGGLRNTVEFKHVQLTAATGIDSALTEVQMRPKLNSKIS